MHFCRLLLFFVLSLVAVSCSCAKGRSNVMRIGVDSEWYPLNFGALQPYVNGYIDELLLEVSEYTGIPFEKVPANWDSIDSGLAAKKYNAILTSLMPYNFNEAKYGFSKTILETGPVLIVSVKSKISELKQMGGQVVGVIKGSPAQLLVQKYGDVLVRSYDSIPALFDAIIQGSLNGTVIDRLEAGNYLNDFYAGQLQIVGQPFTQAGLRLVCIKGQNEYLMAQFNKAIEHFKKRGRLQALQKKWQLHRS